jgi:hypothetical protein
MDALDAGNEQEQQHEYDVHGIKLLPRGGRGKTPRKPAAQIQFVTKTLNQKQSAAVGEGVAFERKRQSLQAFFHGRRP